MRFTIPVALLLVGCSVGPDYAPPDLDLPDGFTETASVSSPLGDTDLPRWWTHFKDPELDRLVEVALAENRTIEVASETLLARRARVWSAIGGFFPQVDGEGSVIRSEPSDNSSRNFQGDTRTSSLGLGLSWELDVFGRLRRNREVASALADQGAADLRGVQLLIVSDLIRSYTALRTIESRLAIAEKNVASQRDIYQLTVARFESGLVSELDVSQSKTVLSTTEATIPELRAARTAEQQQLAILLGAFAARVTIASGSRPEPFDTPSVGIPADLIRRRPDVVAVEQELIAATAAIGVTQGELLPIFTFSGSLGFETLEGGSLLSSTSGGGSFGPAFRWRILEFGKVWGEVFARRAEARAALARYENVVFTAVGEVERALARVASRRAQQVNLREAVAAAERALELSTALYRDGLRDFQAVLDAQRSLLEVEDQLATNRGALIDAIVDLHKAVGGGPVAAV